MMGIRQMNFLNPPMKSLSQKVFSGLFCRLEKWTSQESKTRISKLCPVKGMLAVALIAGLVCSLPQSTQARGKKTTTVNKNERKGNKTADDKKGPVVLKKKKKPKRGLRSELTTLFYYTLPMGDLASSINGGMGGRMHFSLDTLALLGFDLGVKGMNSRLGFNIGYHMFNGSTEQYTANLSMIPMIPYFELNYEFKIGFRLYTRAGYGFTFARAQKQYNVSTINNQRVSTELREGYALNQTIEYTVGALYKYKGFPRMAYYFDASYMMVAESTQAHFLNFALGISWHFYN